MKRIFIIDDDIGIGEATAMALEDEGREIYYFDDPVKAWSLLDNVRADLIISDVWMPWIDGEDIVNCIRWRFPMTKILLMSGYAQGARIAQNYALPFLSKPLDLERLTKMTDMILGLRH